MMGCLVTSTDPVEATYFHASKEAPVMCKQAGRRDGRQDARPIQVMIADQKNPVGLVKVVQQNDVREAVQILQSSGILTAYHRTASAALRIDGLNRCPPRVAVLTAYDADRSVGDRARSSAGLAHIQCPSTSAAAAGVSFPERNSSSASATVAEFVL